MDEIRGFRCVCGSEYAIAPNCPGCGKATKPVAYQRADGSWVDAETLHAQMRAGLKPGESKTVYLGSSVKTETIDMNDLDPELRKALIEELKSTPHTKVFRRKSSPDE
jgi:hypothetical protein